MTSDGAARGEAGYVVPRLAPQAPRRRDKALGEHRTKK